VEGELTEGKKGKKKRGLLLKILLRKKERKVPILEGVNSPGGGCQNFPFSFPIWNHKWGEGR